MLQRHYIAANAYLRGLTQKLAMKEAGYSESMCETDVGSVFGRQDVKEYIAKKKEEMAERNNITEDWIIQRLVNIADANIGALIRQDEEGNQYVDYSMLTPELRNAISGVTIDEVNIGRGVKAQKVKRLKITVADKLRAIEMLAKILDIYKEKVHITSDDDLIRRLQKGRERAAVKEDDEG